MNGLHIRSQLMVDRIFTVPIGEIDHSIGYMEKTR